MMRTVKPMELALGDIIREGKKSVTVTELVRFHDGSCNGVHVNGNLCYDRAVTLGVAGAEN